MKSCSGLQRGKQFNESGQLTVVNDGEYGLEIDLVDLIFQFNCFSFPFQLVICGSNLMLKVSLH